jgi:hypothetical protein
MKSAGSPKGRGLGAPAAALSVALLILVAAFVYVSFSPKQATPTSSTGAPSSSATGGSTSATSTNQISTSHSTPPTSSVASATTSSMTVSRIPDNQSTYAANVAPSSSVTTFTGTNTTNTCAAAPRDATGACVGTDCPLPISARPTQLQVVSDATGTPVPQGAPAVSAVVEYGCQGINIDVAVTLYFDKVSEGSSGWFDLPSITGEFNLTVGYAGHTYTFRAGAYPQSTTCLTLAVPSGTVGLAVYQFSNYDCAGNLEAGVGQSAYGCFGEVYLRLLSDSNSAPVGGANVTTYYDFPSTCGGEAIKSFTTATSSEWYAFGDSSNSFNVTYGGQTYVVTPSQRAGSTCETLHLPSGTVDTTYGPACVVGEPSTTTTSTSTTSNLGVCESATNTQLNLVPKPTVYVKVVTDQGTVITNGSLIVDQLENMTNGFETSNYCISLSDVQATGYVRLADLNQSGSKATFITGGYYDVTLVAGLNNQGPWYTATIPSIQLAPNSTVYVTVSVPSGAVTVVTSNEGSSAVTTTTTTTESSTSTTDNQYVCGVGLWLFKLTPVQNASLYLKLVTSQGVTITNNGTVFVSHSAPNGDGYYGGSGQYCVALNGNATGYAGLTSNDGLAPIGSYGLTLLAGYGQGHVYQVTIPPITVSSNATVYVTVVVPSGEVTVVSCTQGSSCTTSTFVLVGG